MAKTLEKVTKDYASLSAKLSNVFVTSTHAKAGFQKLFDTAELAGKEAGKLAAALRSKGHQGKKLADFKAEKEVAEMIKYAQANATNGKKQAAAVAKVGSQFKPLEKEFLVLHKELEEEVKSRGKKAKILIKSKSLPDLKKLLDRMTKEKKNLLEETEEELEEAKSDTSRDIMKAFEEEFDKSLSKTKEQRKTEQLTEMRGRALNARAQNKFRQDAAVHAKSVQSHCAKALEAAQTGGDAKSELVVASKSQMALKKIAEVQTSSMNTLEGYMNSAKKRGEKKQLAEQEQIKKSMEGLIKLEARSAELLKKIALQVQKIAAKTG
jgi:hypothetical protein